MALMHLAAVQATEMRERLKLIEDILGDDYNPTSCGNNGEHNGKAKKDPAGFPAGRNIKIDKFRY